MPSKNPAILKKHRDAWYRRNKVKQIARQVVRRLELVSQLTDFKNRNQSGDVHVIRGPLTMSPARMFRRR